MAEEGGVNVFKNPQETDEEVPCASRTNSFIVRIIKILEREREEKKQISIMYPLGKIIIVGVTLSHPLPRPYIYIPQFPESHQDLL